MNRLTFALLLVISYASVVALANFMIPNVEFIVAVAAVLPAFAIARVGTVWMRRRRARWSLEAQNWFMEESHIYLDGEPFSRQ
jgi:hypothetical protein